MTRRQSLLLSSLIVAALIAWLGLQHLTAPATLLVRNHSLTCAGKTYPCAIGRSGISSDKHEGDGRSPAGIFTLRRVYYRPDKLATPPHTRLPIQPLTATDGWCDDASHPDYNQPITLPHPASHERLWRDDDLYDIFAVIGWNDQPIIPGRGSAIFLHIARPGYPGTAGCIALRREDLLEVLASLPAHATIDIR